MKFTPMAITDVLNNTSLFAKTAATTNKKEKQNKHR